MSPERFSLDQFNLVKEKRAKPLPPIEQPRFIKEIWQTPGCSQASLELPNKINLPSYAHAVGIIKAIHKQLRSWDRSLTIKYCAEGSSHNWQATSHSKGAIGAFFYYWQATGIGPAGELWFSENLKVAP
jgi:hypothetical protein